MSSFSQRPSECEDCMKMVKGRCLVLQLDTKQKILIAIYTEYQKDIPQMDNIIGGLKQDIDIRVIRIALGKLENEGYIVGYWDKPKSPSSSDRFVHKTFRFLNITRDGIEYVEQKLSIKNTLSNKEKVESVIKNTGEWGLEQLKDLGAKVLSEIIKS